VRFLTRSSLLVAGVTLWIVTIIFRYASLRHGKPPALIWYFSPARLDPLACGILISVLVHRVGKNPLERFRPILIFTGIACWFVAGYSSFDVPDTAPMTVVTAYILIALGAGAFILAAFGLRDSWFVHPWLVYLGRISYGLYIFHATILTMLVVLLQRLPMWTMWSLFPILGLVSTVAIAATSYKWFESPFLRLKRHFQYVRSVPE
jgi:peptidoglycan/LPS O-acetylase OafA/YrhL